jgi:hypothetical protein
VGSRPFCGAAAAFILTIASISSRSALAQSTNELGAWDGLVLSPVGALAPIAHAPGDLPAGMNEIALRYGRWTYDSDDAVHDNIGLTWSRGLGFAHARLSLTGMYEAVECPTCSAWAAGDVTLESTIWHHGTSTAASHHALADAGVRFSLGGAKYLGAEASTAGSAALGFPLDASFPLWGSSSLCASLIPGYGFGHVTGADYGAGGLLPMLGAAVAVTLTSRLALDFGAQRVFIAGGPTQLGAAISIKLGALRAATR